MSLGKRVRIRTQKKAFGALDLQENTLVITPRDILKRPPTPDLNDYLGQYFEEYDTPPNITKADISFSEISPLYPKKGKPSLIMMEETPPRFTEQKEITEEQGTPSLTQKIDNILKNEEKLDFSITGDTEAFMQLPRRPEFVQKPIQRNRVTFTENDASDINTVRIDDFFAKKKGMMINFDEDTGRIEEEPQKSPLNRSSMIFSNMSTSTIPRISQSNIDKFMQVTGLDKPINYRSNIGIAGRTSRDVCDALQQRTAIINDDIIQLEKMSEEIAKTMADNPPSVMMKILSMNSEEMSNVSEHLLNYKQLFSNEAISSVLEHSIELERMCMTQSQEISRIAIPLRTTLNKLAEQMHTVHYTEKDLQKKRKEIEMKKMKQQESENKIKYQTLLGILPFKVNSIRTKPDIPKVVVTKRGVKETHNIKTARPIYQSVADLARKKQIRKEIIELLKTAPDLAFDGNTLSFVVSTTAPATIRFCVSVTVPPSYPWCKLHVVEIRQDIVPRNISEEVMKIAEDVEIGPNMITRFLAALYNHFCV